MDDDAEDVGDAEDVDDAEDVSDVDVVAVSPDDEVGSPVESSLLDGGVHATSAANTSKL